ncbi:cyclic nucleotide-gated cation channel subunit A-like [Daphnia carinata]|uniref:cyclic nucleotide-gated cation channel subunit A-like n=1 Tax=Daphnia carinata TaxID=120202 RepID=UPI00257FB7D9|nr:cyclic nucleotide-gated cation channel subunit A-like [Daphnia carinata]
MSVTVPLVTFDSSGQKQDSKRRTKMANEKTTFHESDAVHLASFTQRMGRWIHRFRRTRQMMSDVHPGPDADFLERFASGEHHHHERQSDIGGKAFLCGQHCRGQLVVDTTQKGHYRWLGIVSMAIMYNYIFIVGRTVFWDMQNMCPIAWLVLDYASDLIYVFDMAVHAHEGYLEQGLMVTDPEKLRRHYWQSWDSKIDIFSLLPTDLLYLVWGSPNECIHAPCGVVVRMNRLFRLPRMLAFFDKTENQTNFPNAFRITKVMIYLLIIIHWNGCIYFAISNAIGFGSDGWVVTLVENGANLSLTYQYIFTFYWSTLTLTTIGETPPPEIEVEFLFVIVEYMIGILIFATIVGNIGSMITNMNASRTEFQTRMDAVKQYMVFRKVSKELEERVIQWFDYMWSNKQSLDEGQVMDTLPDKLKAEIAIHVHLDTLKQVKIFQDCEPGLLAELVLKLQLQVFSPGDYICRKGDVGKEMYIVKRGKLSVCSDDGKTVFVTLGAGSVFGEVSILNIAGNKTGNRRTANVRSVGYSDLFCLSKSDLWNALQEYPEGRKTLLERGRQLLLKDGLLDEEVNRRHQDESDSAKDRIDKLEMALDTLQTRFARLLAEYTSSQQTIKQRISKVEQLQQPIPENGAIAENNSAATIILSPNLKRKSFNLLDVPMRKPSTSRSDDVAGDEVPYVPPIPFTENGISADVSAFNLTRKESENHQ